MHSIRLERGEQRLERELAKYGTGAYASTVKETTPQWQLPSSLVGIATVGECVVEVRSMMNSIRSRPLIAGSLGYTEFRDM